MSEYHIGSGGDQPPEVGIKVNLKQTMVEPDAIRGKFGDFIL